MNLMHRIAAVDHDLLREIAQHTFSLDMVFFLYGGVALVAAVLWAVGTLVFGGEAR